MSAKIAQLALVLGLPLALAAPAARSGFSTECQNIRLEGRWILADCPGSAGTVSSAVWLPSWLSNREGTLTWAYDGNYAGSCTSCSISGSTLQCSCRPTGGPAVTTTINLEDHIANYDGHLLSDLNGTPGTPEANTTPIPDNFSYAIKFGTGTTACSGGFSASGEGPSRCIAYQFAQNLWLETDSATFTTGSSSWSVSAYTGTDCTGDAISVVTPEDQGTCKLFPGKAKSLRVSPLFNASW